MRFGVAEWWGGEEGVDNTAGGGAGGSQGRRFDVTPAFASSSSLNTCSWPVLIATLSAFLL